MYFMAEISIYKVQRITYCTVFCTVYFFYRESDSFVDQKENVYLSYHPPKLTMSVILAMPL